MSDKCFKTTELLTLKSDNLKKKEKGGILLLDREKNKYFIEYDDGSKEFNIYIIEINFNKKWELGIIVREN